MAGTTSTPVPRNDPALPGIQGGTGRLPTEGTAPAPVPSSAIPGIQGGGGALQPPIVQREVPPQDPAAAAANFNAQTNAGVLAAIGANTTNTVSDGGKTGFNTNTAGAVVDGAGAGFSVNANKQETVQSQKANTQAQAAAQQRSTFRPAPDWRVRVSLAPSAKYLYMANNPGILEPLKTTNGVIFPYTPTINVSYSASYEATNVTHSNYRILSYQGSQVGDVSISGEFTAQDTAEANYLLAVIHFFRSCTKMFYGQDTTPRNGVPPPLVYLSGFGAYQFDNHPFVITNFSLNLPSDVDYIRATGGGSGRSSITQKANPAITTSLGVIQRLFGTKLGPGGFSQGPQFRNLDASAGATGAEVTYVPTKIQLSITGSPIITRNDVSNNFSLAEYATGKLLRGSQRVGTGVQSGGMW